MGRLDRDGDPGFDCDLDLIAGPFGHGLAVLGQAFDDQLDHFQNVFERLLLRVAPGSGALVDQSWAVGMPSGPRLVQPPR